MRLSPALARPLRGTEALQLGCGPGATVLDGLAVADWRAITLLDRGVSHGALLLDARRHGDDEARRGELVDLLRGVGALVVDCPGPPHDVAAARLRGEAAAWVLCRSSADPAADPAAGRDIRRSRAHTLTSRRAATVAVVGGGGLGSALTAGFAAAGVGTVALVDDSLVSPEDVVPGGPTAADVGRRVGHATAEAVHRVSPGARTGCPPDPDLVVLVGSGALDAAAAQHLVQGGVAHLGVLVRDDDVAVGPLVLPGRGACLHCLDLHRCDVDPQWPAVLRQLVTGTGRATVPALGQVAAGIAVLLGLSHLDGRGPLPGTTATVSLPHGAVGWARWSPHPRCGCVGLPSEVVGVPGGTGTAGATMNA